MKRKQSLGYVLYLHGQINKKRFCTAVPDTLVDHISQTLEEGERQDGYHISYFVDP
jgi:hypothetical protein